MKLTKFNVENFRSIKNSGPVTVTDRTVLVGRNESGKSNLLLALESLNPTDGIGEIDFTRDFPLDLRADEFDDKKTFLRTTWELTADEASHLAGIHPRATQVTTVNISRDYKGTLYIGMDGLDQLGVDGDAVRDHLARIPKSLTGSLHSKGEDVSAKAMAAWTTCNAALLHNLEKPKSWATATTAAIDAFRAELKKHGMEVPQVADENLKAIEQQAQAVTNDEKASAEARAWIRKQMPIFVYLDEFPELDGHQDMDEFINKRDQGNREEAHRNFQRLCKVAGLDPAAIWQHKDKDADARNRLTNRASAQMTKAIKELWKDRALKVKFSVDGKFFDTRVSDQAEVFDVEVNLNERSRGFRWFFSFYTSFAADTMGGDKDKAILLLDEPGLYLHATSQDDLIKHLWTGYRNQILYTTHSPFMVPTNHIETIRTVERDPNKGTIVHNDPVGDTQTLFPLQSALGYSLTQSLFVGANNLVVEGVTDYWYLTIINERLAERGKAALPSDLVITPAGGAQRVPTMVALLASQKLNVVVLLDHEPEGDNAKRELLRQKLLGDKRILQIGSGTIPGGADIEDLLDPATFEALVKESYKTELHGKTLQLNPSIPRIAKRYEEAFAAIGLQFNKTRPAKLFLRLAAQDPTKWITAATEAKFETLNHAITGSVNHAKTSPTVFETAR